MSFIPKNSLKLNAKNFRKEDYDNYVVAALCDLSFREVFLIARVSRLKNWRPPSKSAKLAVSPIKSSRHVHQARDRSDRVYVIDFSRENELLLSTCPRINDDKNTLEGRLLIAQSRISLSERNLSG